MMNVEMASEPRFIMNLVISGCPWIKRFMFPKFSSSWWVRFTTAFNDSRG